jgi:15-cis-phytoene synthase
MPRLLAPLDSYRYCRAIVRGSASNFALAFHLLPESQHRAMDALYAFMRITDDLSDEPCEVATKRERIRSWRQSFQAATCGEYSHPIHPALHHTLATYGVDPQYLFEVIAGVERDLEPTLIANFAELDSYCYQVASAVGLACLPIWGCREPLANGPAKAAGVAFQLTNILRDLAEDAARGRVYLPRDEIQKFGSSPESWPSRDANFVRFMTFQTERAKRFYTEASALQSYLSHSGRAIFHVMFETYRELLNKIESNNYDVFSARVRVPRLRKLQIFASAWPVKWGWL